MSHAPRGVIDHVKGVVGGGLIFAIMNPYHNGHILSWLQINRHDSLGNLYCLPYSGH